jgi:hypothetical protein
VLDLRELSEKRQLHVSRLELGDLLEAIMIRSRVLSDVAVKTPYVFFTAAAVLFVFMLLLAGLHH